MAIDKLLEYDSRPDATGEALVHPTDGALEKTASDVHPDVQQHLSEAPTPPKDMMRLLITALSSHDTFGPNKNGDGFYRQDLLQDVDYGEHPDGEGNLTIPMYRSFEHFARPYKHHRNNESSPAYGQIERSFYNPQMDRVELLTLLNTAKAPDIARRIRNYEPVKTSMGFRAAYDTCSVCGNKAKSRRDYCDHLKNNMLSVRPDGHIVHARNPKGKFFDISFVGTPADGTSRAVHVGRLPVGDGVDLNKKNKGTGDSSKNPGPTSGKGEGVQSLDDGAKPERSAEEKKEARQSFAKAACAGWVGDQEVTLSADIARDVGLDGSDPLSWRKEADKEADGKQSSIDKRVDGEMKDVKQLSPEKEKKIDELVQKVRGSAPMIQEKVLDRLSGYPLETVASTMAVSGISLRPEEMQHLALTKAGAPQLSRKLWKEGKYLVPSEKTASGGLQLGPDKVDTRLLQKVAGNQELMDGRSFRHGPLIKRLGSEKTAASAMGPNPYLRHRERITPRKAREMATQEEQQTMQERRRVMAREPKKTEQASMLEAIAHLLMGSEWNNGEVSKQERNSLRSNYRQPRQGRRRRRSRMSSRPQQPSMMTMPMANYIRGTGSSPSVYGSSGIAEQAMSKESSLRKEAFEYVQAVAKAMDRMDKVASDQVQLVAESPEKYEAPDVEAALLCRLDQNSS